MRQASWAKTIPMALAAVLGLGIAPLAAQETGTVTGTVTASEGQAPLAGAQISIPGTGLGTLSDQSGQFIIVGVPAGDYTVRAQLIGYGSAEQPVSVGAGQTVTVSFELSGTAIALDEVVVTGTAVATRAKELGNSLETISSQEIERLPIAAAEDAIIGRSPGVTMMLNSGQPGAGSTVKIRGVNTVSQELTPLIYVDGVRIFSEPTRAGWGGRAMTSPLQDIPADDIARIEIVKGAAATTLYGTEAAGGVIQIFTKKGMAGAAQWNAEISTGFNSMGHWGAEDDPTNLFVTCGNNELLYGLDLDDLYGLPGPGDRVYFQDPTCPSDGSWTQDGMIQSYNLSVRGGTENVTYFVSGNYSDDNGVFPTQGSKDGGFRGNFSFQPTDELGFALSTAYARRNTRWIGDGNNSEGFLLNVGRGYRNYLQGGKGDDCADVPATTDEGLEVVCVTNGYVFDGEFFTRNDHFTSGLTTTYNPTDWFSNRLIVGWDYVDMNNETTLPFGHFNLPEGYYWDENTRHTKLSIDYAGSVTNSFMEDQLASTFSFGGQIFRDTHRWTEIDVQTFAGPGEPDLDSGSQLTYRADIPFAETTAGLFVQEQIAWRDLLFITGGVRVDGHSAFGDDFGLQAYPKVSASYVLSDYAFWPAWWDAFKLRAAIGESGKAPPTFAKLRTWVPQTGDEDQPGVTPDELGNSDIGPERTREIEFGFDASWLNGRLGLELTRFMSRTRDALVPVQYPPSQGFISARMENIGELENEGWEFQLRGDLVRTPIVNWEARFTGSLLESNVIDLDGKPLCEDAPDDPNCAAAPGEAYTGLNSYIREGFAFPAYFGNKITNPDAFEDPVIEEDAFLGLVYPDRFYGIGTTLTMFDRLTVDALAEYQGGHSVQNYTGYQNARRGVWYPCYDYQEALLTGGDLSGFTALERGRCSPDEYDNFYWIEDADFLKLRQVSLTYTLPQQWVGRWADNASITVAGRNLFTWTDYTGSDPEMQDASDQFDLVGADQRFGRRDYYQLPTPRTFLFTLRFGF